MIRVAVQKTLLHKPEFHNLQDEALVSDLIEEYLGDVSDYVVVVVGGVCVDPEQYTNTVIEDGDIVYLSVSTPEAELTALEWVYLAFMAYAGYKYANLDIPDANVSDEEKQQRVDGLRNGPRKYEPVPVVLGKHRISPDWAATPFSEVIGDKQYYNLLLCGGYGPQKIEDFRIGDSSILDYEEVTVHYYDGYTAASTDSDIKSHENIIDLKRAWSNDIVQENVSVEIPLSTGVTAGVVTRTTAPDIDVMSLEFSFPQGLLHLEEGVKKETYIQLGITVTNTATQETYKLAKAVPYWSNSNTTYSAYAGDILYDMATGDIHQCNWTNSNDYVSEGVSKGYVRFKGNNLPPGVISIDKSYLNNFDANSKTISLKAGSIATDRAEYTISRKEVDSFFLGVKHDFNPEFTSDTYDVSINVSKLGHSTNTRNTVHWESLTSYRPLSDEKFLELVGGDKPEKNIDGVFVKTFRPVIVAIRIKASNQLSGMLDKFNYQATSVVPNDNAGWESDWRLVPTLPRSELKPCENPAEVYRYFLQGPFNANPLSNDKIDLDGLFDWRLFCVYGGGEPSAGYHEYRVSGYLREQSTLLTELNKIAFTGRAEFSWVDSKYGVSIKREQEIPVQVFTPKNSSGFSSARTFAEDVDGLKFQFLNEKSDYEQDEGVYLNPDKEEEDLKGVYASTDLPYVTDPDLATRHGRFAYFEQRLQRETYVLETDIEGLKCTRGDMVLVQNDVIEVGLGSGRISSTFVGGFFLDETINLVAGTSYGIQIRHTDGTAVETGVGNYVGDGEWTITSGITKAPATGDLVTYGESGKETLECIVKEVDYSTDLSVKLTLVNHSPELYTIDEGAIPEYEPNLISRTSFARPAAPQLSVTTSPADLANGFTTVRFKSEGTNVDSFLLEARSTIRPEDTEGTAINAEWDVVGVTSAAEGFVNVSLGLDNYWEFRGRSLGQNDLYSTYSSVKSLIVPTGPAEQVTSITLEELTNTPKTPNADLSTIVCKVGVPNDPSFSYANIKFRVKGQEGWLTAGRIGPLFDNRVDIVVESDGAVYEVSATSVSLTRVESEDFIVSEITTTDVDEDITDIPVPNVNGLELFEQGNDTEFVGRDADFTWRKTSLNEWIALANETGTGASAGSLDLYFKDYEVRVIAPNGAEAHREYRTDNRFIYTYEQNAEDYKRLNGTEGAFRNFTTVITMRGRNGQVSSKPARLSVSNPAPVLPVLFASAGFTHVTFTLTPPTDRDWTGIKVWLSDTAGFTPNDDNLVHPLGSDTSISVDGLTSGTQYFVKYQAFDAFGEGPASDEFAFTTTKVNSADLDDTPPSVPDNLVLTSGVEEASLTTKSWVQLDWDASTDDGLVSGYFVKYHTDVNENPVEINTSLTTFRITDATPGRTYYVSVKAQDWASNDSEYTDSLSIVASGDTDAPSAPSGVSATGGLDKVVVKWTSPTDDDFLAVKVYKGTDTDFVPDSNNYVTSVVGKKGESVEVVDSDVVHSNDYYYKLIAVDISGNNSTSSVSVGPVKPLRITNLNVGQYFESVAITDAYIQNLDGNKITANTITADQIAANSITVDELDVTDLSAITANLGTITAGTITGATVRTAESGARVQMTTAGGLEGFNGDATPKKTFQVSTDGSGFLGATNPISWTAAGDVSVPGTLVSGEIIGNTIKTATTGWRVELQNSGTPIRIWDGTNSVFSVDELGTAVFKGRVVLGDNYTVDSEDDIRALDGTDGLSAYEQAVANGFNGTEQEWLASLEGVDGDTYYTWIKYADTSTGGGLSDSPTDKEYIGLAYNKTTATESTTASDYTWSLIKGEPGDDGSIGAGFYGGTWVSADWATSEADTRFNTVAGRAPVYGDILVQTPTDGSAPESKKRGSTSWGAVALQVNGDMVATGTIAGDKLIAGTSVHFGGVDDNYIDWNGSTLTLSVDKLGSGASDGGANSLALGTISSAAGDSSVAVGVGATAGADNLLDHDATAVGTGASASRYRSVAIGRYAAASASNTISIGADSIADSLNSVALGTSARSEAVSTISIGTLAYSGGEASIAIGESSNTALGKANAVSLGFYASVTEAGGVAIGATAIASGENAVAVGYEATATHHYSTAIGAGSWTTEIRQIRLGQSTDHVSIPGYTELSGGSLPITIGATSWRGPISFVSRSTSLYTQYFDASQVTDVEWRKHNDGTSFSNVLSINLASGDLRAIGNVSAGYSDIRLKDVIEPLSNSRDALKQWSTFKYTANDVAVKLSEGSYNKDNVEIGLSAQDVQKTHPELIKAAPVDIGEGGKSVSGEDYLTLDYSRTVAVVVDAVNETTDEVEALKERVAQLENLVKELLAK